MAPRTRWMVAAGLLHIVGCGGGRDPGGDVSRPNVLLISIDTLRADRLGCYGYERDTSPALDRFAEHAVVFRDVIAPSPWTIPSHVSMLSGLQPESHGVELPSQAPGADVPMLAERLAAEGYYCFAITDGGWLSAERGFGRGFRAFHDDDQSFAETLEQAEAYIRHRSPRGPWFGFLHTYDVHCPYEPAPPFRSMFASPGREEFDARGKCGNPDLNAMGVSEAQARYLSDLYDGGVREADTALGTFFAHLEAQGAFENTIVVITSDHGEEFLEHGRIGHEQSVHRELLQIPLFVRAPGHGPGVVNDPVALVDLTPTLLELTGCAPLPVADGCSLVARLSPKGRLDPVPGRLTTLRWKETLDSWVANGAHLIVDRARDVTWLYDLAEDPRETTDLSGVDPRRTADLRRDLDATLARLRSARRAPVDAVPSAAELRTLERLGYAGR